MTCILALDQGTTSTRSILFDSNGRALGQAQIELPQHFPQSGWVEHEPEDIWRDSIASLKGALDQASRSVDDVAAIGITNQRETTVLWDRETGETIHRAIVWQDRRGAAICDRLKAEGLEDLIRERSGLLADPYFSGSKIAWLLENVHGARQRAESGKLAFGTIDCFLLWHLTGGKVHATDATNAARTMIFDIHRQDWDDDLLKALKIPRQILPEVLDNDAEFGVAEAGLLGRAIPITGMAGDQQAATIGQACLKPGMMKSTYGTGCFALMNTGPEAVTSKHRLLTTIAYRLDGATTYALEGSIFVAGAAVQWLRDELKLFQSAAETEALAKAADPGQRVILVPAFVGLGAPYWDAHARGAIFGLSRASGPAELTRAALEAVCFQTRDLLEAMEADGAEAPVALRVDGGMVVNDWLLQFLADILGVQVERPVVTETTALGAAYLAGIKAGICGDPEEIAELWQSDARFEPEMEAAARDDLYRGWTEAVARVRSDG
ncbi:MAG: glycerol kinase GlpK [Kiloniellales bacterium]|nr:glycerol kinase GlpK [Kiloniellales bacterium]